MIIEEGIKELKTKSIPFYLTNADGSPFKNKTALSRARKRRKPQFYAGAEKRAPRNGDQAIVLADGSRKKMNGQFPTTRYIFYDGKWVFESIVVFCFYV